MLHFRHGQRFFNLAAVLFIVQIQAFLRQMDKTLTKSKKTRWAAFFPSPISSLPAFMPS